MIQGEADQIKAEQQNGLGAVGYGERADFQGFERPEVGAEAKAEAAEVYAGRWGDVAACKADPKLAGHGDAAGSTRYESKRPTNADGTAPRKRVPNWPKDSVSTLPCSWKRATRRLSS